MATVDDIDSHLIQTGLPYEQVGKGTWLINPESARPARIGVQFDDPIVLFSIPVLDVTSDVEDPGGLYRLLLTLNSELLHSSYSLQSNRVMLSGAQQVENLDFNEFQAMIDDMCMALDRHWERLAPWGLKHKGEAAAAEGSA